MILPGMYYSLREIEKFGRAGFFPIKSRHTLSRYIKAGILKSLPIKSPSGKVAYKVKGDELIRFMEYGNLGSLLVNDDEL